MGKERYRRFIVLLLLLLYELVDSSVIFSDMSSSHVSCVGVLEGSFTLLLARLHTLFFVILGYMSIKYRILYQLPRTWCTSRLTSFM